jgi:hypothetical protein
MGSVEQNKQTMKAYRDYWDQLDILRDGFNFSEDFLKLYSDDVVCVWAGNGVISGRYEGKKAVFDSIKKSVDIAMNSTWGVKNVAEYVGDDGFATLEEVTDGDGKFRAFLMFRYAVNDEGVITHVETFLGDGSLAQEDFRAPNVSVWGC